MRCTVLGSAPNRTAILRTPSVRPGAFRAARIRVSRACPFSRFGRLPRENSSAKLAIQSRIFMEAIRLNANEKSILRDLAIYDYVTHTLPPVYAVQFV